MLIAKQLISHNIFAIIINAHLICANKYYFPAGKKPKVKAGTIIFVFAFIKIKSDKSFIIVPPFVRILALLVNANLWEKLNIKIYY